MPKRPAVFGAAARPTRKEARRVYDRERYAETETRRLMSTKAWRDLRADQLTRHPLCRFCFEAGHVKAASVCDHVEPHRGDVAAFWRGPFQSLCITCHNRRKQAEEARAARAAGWGGGV